ncbi:tetratricopeptide repeat protein [Stieleria varia]|nr:tetratricopeptide repeat protein [Stieleria varia]
MNRPSAPLRSIACLLFIVLTPTALTGCRAIRKIGDNGESIAARRLSREGIKAMHDGRWDVAENLFGDALEISKADDRAHRGLAEALWNRGEHDAAIVHMENAVRLSAGDPKLVARLGRMYLENGRLEDANAQCQIALSAERNSADIWALHGDCLNEHGEVDEALSAYHRALALQPNHLDVQIQTAEIYRIKKRFDRLLATLDRIELNGDGADVPARVDLLRGIAMRQLGRTQEAHENFALAAKKNPDDAEPWLHMASIETEAKNFNNARQYVAMAMERDPQLVQQSGWSRLVDSPGTMSQDIPHVADARDAVLQ